MTREPKRLKRHLTARELAQRFNVSVRTIQASAAEERHVYEARANQRREQIVDLHRRGRGVRAIARQLGVSPGLVSTRLSQARAAGIDLTPHPQEPDTDTPATPPDQHEHAAPAAGELGSKPNHELSIPPVLAALEAITARTQARQSEAITIPKTAEGGKEEGEFTWH